MAPPKPLFDDEDEKQQTGQQLRVNQDFAKRFEHNKKREELHRLQEKYPEQAAKFSKDHARQAKAGAPGAPGAPGGAAWGAAAAAAAAAEEGDSSSDGEDDDDGVLPDKTEAQILETLIKIRQRDQSIYDTQAKFYSSSSEGEAEEEEDEGRAAKGSKKEKPMYLKDVMFKQALEGDISSDEEQPTGAQEQQQGRTYVQEQQQLKKAFLSAFDEEAPEGAGEDAFGSGVLQQRKRKQQQKLARKAAAGSDANSSSGEEEGDDAEEGAAGGAGAGRGGNADAARVQQLLDGYFGRDAELDPNEKFLKRYILNKGWVEEGDGDEDGLPGYNDEAEDVDVEDDEQFVEQAEQFEHAYNFRFEEPGAFNIITHPRNIEGTVRKEDDRRKRQRAEKAERQAAAEEQRRAEVRRLKNLKKAEIEDKLGEIQSVAGQAAPRQDVLDALVGGDFDPEEYDRQMAAAFGEDYYGADADGDEDDLEDEAFEKELEAMAKYGSDDEEPQSFAALHKRLTAQRREQAAAGGGSEEDEEEAEEEGEEEGEEEEVDEEAAGRDPEAAAAARAEVQRLLEEYFKLDYEDVVGGIPTRFRYKEVAPDSYGLGIDDILSMEDKELNQVVGLKTLAPYREEHKKFRPNYSKLNELRRQKQEEGQGGQGKPFGAKQQQWGQQGRGQGRGQGAPWQQQGDCGGGGGRGGFGGRGSQQRQWQEGQQREWQPRVEKSAAERRLESFAKPTFKKKGAQQLQPQQRDGGAAGGAGGSGGQQHADKKRKREQQAGGGGGGGAPDAAKPKPKQPQQQAAAAATAGSDAAQAALSKAAKKNQRRAEKRAAKRVKTGDA